MTEGLPSGGIQKDFSSLPLGEIHKSGDQKTPPTTQKRRKSIEIAGKILSSTRSFFSKTNREFKLLGSGALKAAYIRVRRDSIGAPHPENNKVYLRPKLRILTSFFERDFKIMASIGKKVRETLGRPSPYLATEFEKAEGSNRLGGKFKVSTYIQERATPLDTVLPDRELTLGKRLNICGDMIEGLSHLHQIGMIHRDIKPDNFLFSKDGNAMVTDFGTTIDEQGAARASHKGNSRYADPNGNKTAQSEVWSMGLMCVKAIESGLLKEGEETLMDETLKKLPPDKRERYKPAEGRKGLERFMLIHKGFVHTCENHGPTSGGKSEDKRRKKAVIGHLTTEQREEEQALVDEYLNALETRLEEASTDKQQVKATMEALRGMLKIDPKDRSKLTDVLTTFREGSRAEQTYEDLMKEYASLEKLDDNPHAQEKRSFIAKELERRGLEPLIIMSEEQLNKAENDAYTKAMKQETNPKLVGRLAAIRLERARRGDKTATTSREKDLKSQLRVAASLEKLDLEPEETTTQINKKLKLEKPILQAIIAREAAMKTQADNRELKGTGK